MVGMTDLKTRYQYIHFVQVDESVLAWACYNNRSNARLGEVRWYARWRQYCYFPTVQAVYSAGCLADIEAFIEAVSRGLWTKEGEA